MTVTSGYFPEVELLGGEWDSETHFPKKAERGKVDSVTICSVSASIVKLALVWVILPQTVYVSKNHKALCERNRFPLLSG